MRKRICNLSLLPRGSHLLDSLLVWHIIFLVISRYRNATDHHSVVFLFLSSRCLSLFSTEAGSVHLVVFDGTWRQAKKMHDRGGGEGVASDRAEWKGAKVEGAMVGFQARHLKPTKPCTKIKKKKEIIVEMMVARKSNGSTEEYNLKFQRDAIDVKTNFWAITMSSGSTREVSIPYGIVVWSTGIGTHFMNQVGQIRH
ncbi:hypothetical protein ZIOFF_068899 [Zingiber officinale]|uniref:Uncharacterized protein n=1 Tax=Zingiber officinale TaxID=94328 RepID=A0A8J5ECA9_ZINOF|nr:hypothetical protein ZIOFF_068899 [Zingiber officinale]